MGRVVKAAEAQELVGNALFVDVREPYEYAAGHIEGSLHIPMTQIPERWEEVESEAPIVVVCHLGQRSAIVAEFLQNRGVPAQNLEGGLEEWGRAGFPLTEPEPDWR